MKMGKEHEGLLILFVQFYQSTIIVTIILQLLRIEPYSADRKYLASVGITKKSRLCCGMDNKAIKVVRWLEH